MRILAPLSLGLALASAAGAQSSIPLRQLAPAVATDSGVVVAMMGVRPLPGGGALVNDFARRRLILFDSTLRRFTVVADTAAGAPQPYWALGGALLAFAGDSSVFVDQESRALIVIDASGKVVHAMAPPKVDDVLQLMAGVAVGPSHGFDPQGRLVYRVPRRPPRPQPLPRGSASPDSGVSTVVVRHDSAAIVRADPDTRRVDTVAFLALPAMKLVTTSLGNGRNRAGSAENPLPSQDEWALLSDGTIAVVRTGDYHIDWYRPDGTSTSTPKMAFDWRRVTTEDKQRMLDSAEQVFATKRQPQTTIVGGRSTYMSGEVSLPKFVGVDPSDMPDYYPPIRPGSVHADTEGNVWILPTTSVHTGGGLVYDVVNRKGEVFERVELPPGRNIIAFGPGGMVYMLSSWAPRVPRLERARVIR